MELLNMFALIANYYFQTPLISNLDEHLENSRPSTPAATSTPTETISSQTLSASDLHLKKLFEELLKNDAYKNLWEEVNHNLHKPIDIRVAAVEKGSTVRGYIYPAMCPQDQECHKKPSSTPHTFNIYINVERSKWEIFRSIIFETCNAKSWPEHHKIDWQARRKALTEDEFTLKREEIEWQAMKRAKKIADEIDPKIYQKMDPRIFTDFDFYLKAQTNHQQNIKKQYQAITKHHRSDSLDQPKSSKNLDRSLNRTG